MGEIRNILANTQVLVEVGSENQEITCIGIKVAFDAFVIPQSGSSMIVVVNLSLDNADPSKVRIVQYIPVSNIQKGDTNNLSIVPLDGILWVSNQRNELEIIDASAIIYYTPTM